jgi:putative ABC transport system ATP-binding protein
MIAALPGDSPENVPAIAAESDPVLKIQGLRASRHHGDASFNLSLAALTLKAGEPVAVVGPSGSGKSTLLDVLGLVMTPDKIARFTFFPATEAPVDLGRLFAERDERGLTDLRRRHFGYMPQTGGLLPFLSVVENIRLPARISGHFDAAYLDNLSQLLELPLGLMGRYPKDLSIGQRQRVSLARALAHRPRLVLADEPTASLDVVAAAAVSNLLLDLSPRLGITPVIATHDERLVARAGVRRIHLVSQAGAAPHAVDAMVAA